MEVHFTRKTSDVYVLEKPIKNQLWVNNFLIESKPCFSLSDDQKSLSYRKSKTTICSVRFKAIL